MDGMEESTNVENLDALLSKMPSEFNAEVLSKLISVADETKRCLCFIAWLNGFLGENNLGRIIITGGFAVEVYTGRM